MAIVAVIASKDQPGLGNAITGSFPKHLNFGPGQWVVSADGLTAPQVAEKLGVSKGALGQVVVFTVANHWGYHRKDLWEWLDANAD